MNKIQFELVDNVLTAEEFIQSKVDTGFWDRPLEQVENALVGGIFNVSAICDGKIVGMGRLVGDGAMYWYLQDIIVLPEYQGNGIGKSIVSRLIEYVKSTAMSGTNINIGLTAIAGKETFYEKFGFSCISTGMVKNINIEA